MVSAGYLAGFGFVSGQPGMPGSKVLHFDSDDTS